MAGAMRSVLERHIFPTAHFHAAAYTLHRTHMAGYEVRNAAVSRLSSSGGGSGSAWVTFGLEKLDRL